MKLPSRVQGRGFARPQESSSRPKGAKSKGSAELRRKLLDARDLDTLADASGPAPIGGRPSSASKPFVETSPSSWIGRFGKAVSAAVLGAMLVTGCASHPGMMGSAPPVPHPSQTYVVETRLVGAPLEGVSLGQVRPPDSVRQLVPAATQIDPTGLYDQLGSGQLDLRIPLKAGQHEIGGKTVTVRPGTVATIAVEVRDGKVVPTEDGRTYARISPSLQGPLHVQVQGAYLEPDGFMIDLWGWGDQAVGSPTDRSVSSLMASLSSGEGAGGSADILDLERASFRIDEARLAAGRAELGSLTVNLAEGNVASLQGSLQSAMLDGQLRIRSASLAEDGLVLQLGAGSVDVRAATNETDAGETLLTTTLSDIDATVTRFEARPRDSDDHLVLSDAHLAGRIELRSHVDTSGEVPSLEHTRAGFEGHFSGTVASSHLTLEDDDGTAELALSGHIEADGRLGGEGISFEAQIEDGKLSVKDLDRDGRLSIDRAELSGDARVSLSSSGALEASVDASRIDVRISDLRSEDGTLDLGRTEVSGHGRAWLDGAGLRIEGEIDVRGTVDDLRATGGAGQASRIDVGRGSTYSGTLRRLELANEGSPRLEGRIQLGFDLESMALNAPGASFEGSGRLDGPAQVSLSQGRFQLSDADTRLRLDLRDGKVGEQGSFHLDFARNSRADLRLRALDVGGTAGTSVTIGAGSRMDLRLDGGELDLGGRTIQLEAGTAASFRIDRLTKTPGGLPELRGSLEIDSPLDLGNTPADHLRPHRPDLRGTAAAGIRIDDVTLAADGRFRLEGVDVALEARAGAVERLSSDARRYRLHALLERQPELSSHQDLINYFYRIGGGEWSGAQNVARSYGLDLTALTADRSAAASELLPADKTLDIAHARAELDIPSMEEVRSSTAAQLAGIETAQASFDPWAIARAVHDGSISVNLPLEGNFGSGLKGVTFEPGTQLEVRAEVRDGHLVPDEFSASLSQPGDAFLWTELEGAYLDDERNLKLDIAGWFDATVPGFEELPLDVAGLIDRVQNAASASGESTGADVIDWSQVQVSVTGAEIPAGTEINLPIGSFVTSEALRVDATTADGQLQLSGPMRLSDWKVATPLVGIEAGDTRAHMRTTVQLGEDGAMDARLVFEGLEGQLSKLAFVDARGSHISLGEGHVEGRIEVGVSRDAEGAISIRPDISIDRFDGDIHHARFLASEQPAEGPPARFELTQAHLDGHFRLTPELTIEVGGTIEQAEATVRNLVLHTPDGDLHIDAAHFDGGSTFDYGFGNFTALDTWLRGSAELRSSPEGLSFGSGEVSELSIENGRALLRFAFDSVDHMRSILGQPFEISGVNGHLGGQGQAESITGVIQPTPRPKPPTSD